MGFWSRVSGVQVSVTSGGPQVAAELGDAVRIVKVDVDQEQALASHLQARLPVTASVFVESCHFSCHVQSHTGADCRTGCFARDWTERLCAANTLRTVAASKCRCEFAGVSACAIRSLADLRNVLPLPAVCSEL